jgi:hypothetical protein
VAFFQPTIVVIPQNGSIKTVPATLDKIILGIIGVLVVIAAVWAA